MFGIEDFSKAIVDFQNFEVSQLGDALLFGGAILLIGMTAIFAVLSIILLCLTLFKLFFHDIPAKRAEAKSAHETKVEVADAPVAQSENDDGEIIAAIAAAIAMAESEGSGAKFRVVSFTRR